ncbi:MAG TPA: DUF4296 domain-containing protein [Flavisolibacter sp.]|jgi:hypothetical protein|nr:DUF4296 domain-containing protein [Flavisolibacter sp.]
MIRTFCLLLLLALFACADEKKLPPKILGADSMQVVLYDMLEADEMVTYNVLKDSSYQSGATRIALYEKVFNKHKITKDQFQESLRYYESRPDFLKGIFDSLKARSDKPADTARHHK